MKSTELLMVLFFFVSTIFISSLIVWWIWFQFSKWTQTLNRIPGPRPWPLIGNAFDLIGDCSVLMDMFQRWAARYGPIFRLYIGTSCYVFISSPQYMEAIMSSKTLLEKGKDYDAFRPWLGDGILNSKGEKWRRRKRLLTPAFSHPKILSSFVDIFNEQSLVLCDKLLAKCRSKGHLQIDMHAFLSLCAFDIICESSMGCRMNAQQQESEFLMAHDRISQIVMERANRPWLRSDRIFSLTELGREHEHCLKVIHTTADRVIANRRVQLEQTTLPSDSSSHEPRRAFLDSLLESRAAGEDLTDDDIRDEVNTFMSAGHDTTAAAMSWFLYCMAANPEYQEQIHEELDDLFGDSDRFCNLTDLAELKFLDWSIKESLRLFPSVPYFDRFTTEPVRLDQYEIPVGCNIRLFPFALHRDARNYPDPLRFNPYRFTAEHNVGRHPYAYVPFGAGIRNCIGQRFALMEEKIVLSTLLRRFVFRLPPDGARVKLSIEMVLKPLDGLHLIVSARR